MQYTPRIRIISVDHALTVQAAQLLTRTLHEHNMQYPLREVYCHLEAGRCGLKVGAVGIEVDGNFVWAGGELSAATAEIFCHSLKAHVQRMQTAKSI